MSDRKWIALGALLMGLDIGLGAIGAHMLREKLSVEHLASFETAVRYQAYHALGILLIGILSERYRQRCLQWIGLAFLAGMLLFSGGIYAWLATGTKAFIHVVPVGGFMWIIAWFALAVTMLVNRPAVKE